MHKRITHQEPESLTMLLDMHLERSHKVYDQLKTRFWAEPQKPDNLLVSDAMSVIRNLQNDIDWLRDSIRDYESYLSKREEIEASFNL